MKYKVFSVGVLETLKGSKKIKEYFTGDYDHVYTQYFYNLFMSEISKITTIPKDIMYYQSNTTSELLYMMEELWDAMIPIDEDHEIILNGWKTYYDVYGHLKKRHKDLYHAYRWHRDYYSLSRNGMNNKKVKY